MKIGNEGEPNDLNGEDFLEYSPTVQKWNDSGRVDGIQYILEKTYTSDPLLADTDGDGLTDAQEVNGFSQYEMVVGILAGIKQRPMQKVEEVT